MEDLQKIKDFFSKPLEEDKAKINDIKKRLNTLGVGYKMSKTNKVKPFEVIYKPINRPDEFYKEFEDIVNSFNLQGVVKSSMNETKSEDAVDAITMDIPLFLRMLEYSREDASQDMDLHDVTEKANALGKERGILSMEDYEEIVGAAEEVKEVEGSITAPKWNSMDVKSKIKLLRYHFPKLSLKFADWKWEDLTPMIKNKLTHREQGLEETLLERVLNRIKNDQSRTKR